jgi:hypothetical protein
MPLKADGKVLVSSCTYEAKNSSPPTFKIEDALYLIDGNQRACGVSWGR